MNFHYTTKYVLWSHKEAKGTPHEKPLENNQDLRQVPVVVQIMHEPYGR